jgi:hypothetical protein
MADDRRAGPRPVTRIGSGWDLPTATVFAATPKVVNKFRNFRTPCAGRGLSREGFHLLIDAHRLISQEGGG